MRDREANSALLEIRDADEPALARIISGGLEHLDASQMRALFLNPQLSEVLIRRILERPEHLSIRGVRRALAAHRRTPQADALRLVPTLFWSELLDLGRETRVLPAVRRAAHQILTERYDALPVGARLAIARRAGVELLPRVRLDPEPRVIEAMLENPRLTEGVLQSLAAGATTRPQTLAVIAGSRKWSARLEVRRLLCRNPRTPIAALLTLLPRLDRRELENLEKMPGIQPQARRRVRTLLGKDSLA
jgi:hypothetical protein